MHRSQTVVRRTKIRPNWSGDAVWNRWEVSERLV